MSRVHVLGNAGMDWSLHVARPPAPGETLVGRAPHRAPGGKGLNQAVASARAGAATRFLAPLGDDGDADLIAAALAREGFEALELPRMAMPTDGSLVMLTPDGENCIVSVGACAEALEPAEAARFAAGVGPGEVLLMQGNLSAAATRAALDAAAGRAVLNTAPLQWDVRPMLPLCAVVVANAVEALAITGADTAAALHGAGAAVAVVTLGAAGCRVADAAGERLLPASACHLVDSTGAGDAFCGTLAALLAAGWPILAAAAAAQRVAGRTVERRGAYPALPGRAETASLIGPRAG